MEYYITLSQVKNYIDLNPEYIAYKQEKSLDQVTIETLKQEMKDRIDTEKAAFIQIFYRTLTDRQKVYIQEMGITESLAFLKHLRQGTLFEELSIFKIIFFRASILFLTIGLINQYFNLKMFSNRVTDILIYIGVGFFLAFLFCFFRQKMFFKKHVLQSTFMKNLLAYQ